MIKIRIKGRLGNQLFIYAFARAMSEKFNQEVLIYDRKDETDQMWHSHLEHYRLSHKVNFISDKKAIMKMKPYSYFLFLFDRIFNYYKSPGERKKFEEKHKGYYIKHGLFICVNGYTELPEQIPEDIFCDGYFQSPSFFNCIREALLEELIPKNPMPDSLSEMLRGIKNTNSVCVTIRLGDYSNNPVHNVCNASFYLQAMERMHELMPDCVFYIFSDEIEKVKEKIPFRYPVVFDSGTGRDFESLFCMSQCRHFIVSNSSFSWWAQYLSQNPDKIVIAPSRWYLTDIPCDIYEDNWICLEC